MEHGITFRKRLWLRKYGIERTKLGYCVNVGRLAVYIR
jgi:hypothetical protein